MIVHKKEMSTDRYTMYDYNILQCMICDTKWYKAMQQSIITCTNSVSFDKTMLLATMVYGRHHELPELR